MITEGFREGQVEIYEVDPDYIHDNIDDYKRFGQDYLQRPPNTYLLIKIYHQTDDEAGGSGIDRRMLVDGMEGKTYFHNGIGGIYKNTATCTNPPREYAKRTILIRDTDVVSVVGDWDYSKLIEDNPKSGYRYRSQS